MSEPETVRVRIEHPPEGSVGWSTIHPDGTVTHEYVPASDEPDDGLEDGMVIGAYLETGEVLYGRAAEESYRRLRDV